MYNYRVISLITINNWYRLICDHFVALLSKTNKSLMLVIDYVHTSHSWFPEMCKANRKHSISIYDVSAEFYPWDIRAILRYNHLKWYIWSTQRVRRTNQETGDLYKKCFDLLIMQKYIHSYKIPPTKIQSDTFVYILIKTWFNLMNYYDNWKRVDILSFLY